MSLSRFALLNPTTSEYYLNPIGTPLLFNTEEEAEKMRALEMNVYRSLPDAHFYVPIEIPHDEVAKLNKITLKKGILK